MNFNKDERDPWISFSQIVSVDLANRDSMFSMLDARIIKKLLRSWLELSLRKKCPNSELFWSVFSRIRSEYGEVPHISPYSVWMWEETDQNNSEYGYFPRSVYEAGKCICVWSKLLAPLVQEFIFIAEASKIQKSPEHGYQSSKWQESLKHDNVLSRWLFLL